MDIKVYNKGIVIVACDHLLKRLREHGRIVSPSKYLCEFAGQADANERRPASSLTFGIFDEATNFWVVDLRENHPEYLHIIKEFIKNFFTKMEKRQPNSTFMQRWCATPPYSKGK